MTELFDCEIGFTDGTTMTIHNAENYSFNRELGCAKVRKEGDNLIFNRRFVKYVGDAKKIHDNT